MTARHHDLKKFILSIKTITDVHNFTLNRFLVKKVYQITKYDFFFKAKDGEKIVN